MALSVDSKQWWGTLIVSQQGGPRSRRQVCVDRVLWDHLEGPRPPEGFSFEGALGAPDVSDEFLFRDWDWDPKSKLPPVVQVPLHGAAAILEYAYRHAPFGATARGRKEADQRFARNCLRTALFYDAPADEAVPQVLLRYEAVRNRGRGRGSFGGTRELSLLGRLFDAPNLGSMNWAA